MRFFTMEQDKMLQDMAKLRDFDICGPRHIFFRKDAAVIKPSTTLYFAADSGEALPDFIQSPIPLVYHTLLLEEQEMLSDSTEYYPNGSVKRLVLDRKKIGEHKVFLADTKKFRNPFVSLEIVESILRRNPVGIIFREVEVE